jgi:hypothetical protein
LRAFSFWGSLARWMRKEGGVEAEGDKEAESPAVLLRLRGAAASPGTVALRAGDFPPVAGLPRKALADSRRQQRADGKARPAPRSLLLSKPRNLVPNRASARRQ